MTVTSKDSDPWAILTRFRFTKLTRGALTWRTGTGLDSCHTLELPWRSNKTDVSCIPMGDYRIEVSLTSPSKGVGIGLPRTAGPATRSGPATYGVWVTGVEDRSGILIHVGNTLKDTRGCILVGDEIYDDGVLHSRRALRRLVRALDRSRGDRVLRVV